jgi:Mrp family chromosome partitioning ATPase
LHKALVADLKKSFDYVVIDTPPVGPVVDSVIVAAGRQGDICCSVGVNVA